MIHMQQNLSKPSYLVGSAEIADAMPNLLAMPPFDARVLSFLQALSEKLRSVRGFSDVVTFSFWCRKAALNQAKALYDDLDCRIGRGVVFHIAPSNVPVNFAFSLVSGLLAGNANIVRVPSKEFPQVTLIATAIRELLAGEYSALAPYICLVRYLAEKGVNDTFSSLCDVRVIWGGDSTVAEVRRSPLKARATEITFADRHSIAVIDSDAYLACEAKDRLAQDFYNDTYFSDQNACTSPRIVFWTGTQTTQARTEFWTRLHMLVKEKYTLAAVQSVGKIDAVYQAAVAADVREILSEDMLVTRLEVGKLSNTLMDYKYNSGFFYEKEICDLSDVLPVCDSSCQTLSYYGIEPQQLADFLRTCRPRGIDRAVPIGKTMDFNLVWDGCDLIRTMSRKISIL